MRRPRYKKQEKRKPEASGHGFLFFAIGALTGAATGAYLSRRYHTREEFTDDVRAKLARLREYWDATDNLVDDEDGRDRRAVNGDEAHDELSDHDEPFALSGGEEGIPSLEAADDNRPDDAPGALARDASADRTLEARVLGALEDDVVLRDRAVDIAAVGSGVVELTGWVRSPEESARAASLAREVSGVTIVLNRIGIRGAGSVDTASAVREPELDAGVERPVRPEGTA